MKNRTMRNRIFRKMTAALLAAVLMMTAAQGLAASEGTEQVQVQTEPASKQPETKKAREMQSSYDMMKRWAESHAENEA